MIGSFLSGRCYFNYSIKIRIAAIVVCIDSTQRQCLRLLFFVLGFPGPVPAAASSMRPERFVENSLDLDLVCSVVDKLVLRGSQFVRHDHSVPFPSGLQTLCNEYGIQCECRIYFSLDSVS